MEYDHLYRQAEHELDAVKRAAMYIKLNEIVVSDHYILPEVSRPRVTTLKNGMVTHLSGWDNDLWQLANWYREV
jgi:peptide/nickel transport system substrate-binding protein